MPPRERRPPPPAPGEPDDAALAALLAAVRAGDEAAVARVLAALQPYIARRARWRAGARLGASDLAQDTAEQALRTLRLFRGQSAPELRAFLDGVLRNLIGQRLRAARRGKRDAVTVPLPLCDQATPLAAPGPSPSQALRGKEAWRALLRAVAALPEAQRLVVRRHLRGASVAELAAELGRTPAAISCLLQRGGQALRAALGDPEERSLGDWFVAMQALLRDAP